MLKKHTKTKTILSGENQTQLIVITLFLSDYFC
ncbi:unnamed protein product [Schistosoma margrebowiei]|uniref:Uncharacterized protein n=1 Tax=Schistosoma margrebowiei TaxID=48269 RepID=A0A3P8EDX7_9TREM|nr:unnamed protein product [Schistosoma margrebowiei]